MGKGRALITGLALHLVVLAFAQSGTGRILILSNSTGHISVDGKALGNVEPNVPMVHEVAPGEHLVQLAYMTNGLAAVHNDVVIVEEGKQKVVNITIAPTAVSANTPTPVNVIDSVMPVPGPGGQTGTVYLMRRTGYSGSLGSYAVFMDGTRICTVNNKQYSVHQVKEGSHRFTVRVSGSEEKESAEPLMLTIEAGKTYYLSLVQRTGWKINLSLAELMESSGKAALTDLKLDTKCE